MKKASLFSMAIGLLAFLPGDPAVSAKFAARQQAKPTYVQIPIKITPDQAKVTPAFEGGEPPTFTIQTDPRVAVSIMVATGFDLLITEKGQSIENVFITYYGSESAGIAPAVLKADEEGRLTYTLPARVFEAMSEGPSRIYYVAEVIDARDNEHYDVVGVSFDYQSGQEEDAPYIAIEESPRIAQAQEHFKTAQAHYAKKEYAAAAKEYNEALILYPNPAFEYNIGLSHLKLGLQYLAAAVERGRFRDEQETAIKEFIATVEDSLETLKQSR